MTPDDLPEPLTLESIETGQSVRPEELTKFLQVLYTGSENDIEHERVHRLVNSVTDDIVFNVTRGKVKPGKQLCLGLGIKSLTGSRRVIEVLNRFGNSVAITQLRP